MYLFRNNLKALFLYLYIFRLGVDLNQAPSYLLSYVSGITANMAQKIVKWRCQNGQFGSRDQLRKVKGIGEKAFQQCAGFVRIMPKEK